eukprot:192337-Hanusia_phi.AAC.1
MTSDCSECWKLKQGLRPEKPRSRNPIIFGCIRTVTAEFSERPVFRDALLQEVLMSPPGVSRYA